MRPWWLRGAAESGIRAIAKVPFEGNDQNIEYRARVFPQAAFVRVPLRWLRAWHAARKMLGRAGLPSAKPLSGSLADESIARAPIQHLLVRRLAEIWRLSAASIAQHAGDALYASAVVETSAKTVSELSLLLGKLMARGISRADLSPAANNHFLAATVLQPVVGSSNAYNIHDTWYETRGPACSPHVPRDQDPYLARNLGIRRALADFFTKPIAAVLILNLDRFGRINQRYGTKVGDALLDQLAARLDNAITPIDAIAYGHGDEFVILRKAVGEIGALQDLALELLRTFEMPFKIGSSLIHTGATIGIARFPHDGVSISELVGSARAALSSGKLRNRGDWQFFRPGMKELLQAAERMRRDLLGAVSQGQLFILYEPLVGLHTGRIEALEAMLRWRHPELGVLTPDIFMPIAEQSGSHVPIANWLLQEACRDAAGWPRSINVAVKLPARFFGIGSAESIVSGALQKHGTAASRLELGVPASLMADDDTFNSSELSGIRRLGVRIALDELGNGFAYSGILNGLRVDKIKLEMRSLVRSSQDREANCVAPLAQSHALGVVTVATGVTSQSDCDALREMGCMQAQGTLLAGPLPIAEARALIFRQAHQQDWP